MSLSKSNSRKIRILLVAPSLEILGGQSRQAVRLLEALTCEPEVEVGFQPHNPRLPRGLRWMQRVKYLRTLSTSLLYWAMLLTRVWRYDVVHTFSAAYYSYLLAALPALAVAKLYGKKAVLNYRSGEADDHLARWRVSRATMRLADEMVVPSGYLVEVFARYGLKARAIFNIVELEKFRFRLRQPLRPVFLTSRLLEPLYNVPCVLRAFSLIQQRYPEARLTVAADGWMRKDLERLAAELGLRHAQFIGRVAFDKMPSLYDAADVYLMANDIDNMPGSIIECMAAGVNVVTTDAGGIPYILTNEETGLLVRRGDHEALAAAALRLLEDDKLACKLSVKARQACKKFTWPEVRDEWLKLYRELAHEVVQSRNEVKRLTLRSPRTHKHILKGLPLNGNEDRPGRDAGAPVRILVVAPSLDIIGGQAVQANRLVESLSQEARVEVGFQPHNPRLPRGLRWMQRVKYLRTLSTSLLYWAMLLTRVWRYDVVHTFSAAYYSYLLAALPALAVAKLYGKKAVLNYHSGEADDHLARWRVSRATMRLADEVVVPSGYLVEVFAGHGLKARAIFNIVELEKFHFRLRQPLRPVFMSNRNLIPMYNVSCILRTFSLIQQRYPEARLIVAGDGCQGRELKELANELGLRNTKFISYVHPRNMPELYAEADIFLNSSDIDNMPNSIIESFASGLPVVTTDAGGIPFILTHEGTGLMVRRDDHKAMADCVFRLLEDAWLAERIARRAHEDCVKYTWPEVRKEWINLFTELACEGAALSEEQGAVQAATRNDQIHEARTDFKYWRP